MALPEETEIMSAIGFGSSPNWHAGGSCRGTRQRAVERLPEVLQELGLEPIVELMELLDRVARYGEESDYVLAATWRCASDVIRTHLAPEGSRTVLIEDCLRLYEPRRHEQMMDIYGRLQ